MADYREKRPHPSERKWFNLNLSVDGTIADTDDNMIQDYSSARGAFYHTALQDMVISRLLVHIEDSAGMADADYGNITSGLSAGNGIFINVYADDFNPGPPVTGTVKYEIIPPQVQINTNAEWGQQCYDYYIANVGAGTNDFLNARFSFHRGSIDGLYLKKGEVFAVTANANLTGLISHQFLIQGHYMQGLPR